PQGNTKRTVRKGGQKTHGENLTLKQRTDSSCVQCVLHDKRLSSTRPVNVKLVLARVCQMPQSALASAQCPS
ncbi:hypothetical protein BaRGS_00018299, partial [Batillaria attramentaria]